MKFGVVTFPGSNGDYDSYTAAKFVLGKETVFLWHKSASLEGADVIILPGGFSYGDYLRSGAIARFSPIMKSVIAFAQSGGIVIGFCNGFQVLMESGLLPGALMRNSHLRFRHRFVYLKTENHNTPFTNMIPEGKTIKVPIAHGDGNFYNFQADVDELEKNSKVIFRYSDMNGKITNEANPNGSLNNIAGISNREGNVLGMMPHPERAVESILGSDDGLLVFDSMVNYLVNKPAKSA
ncbi:MAG: phosphoribosylformylglycinamidine synthase subunit PurQ [candidate division Zixibacteria bacterium]|nr:phosphoribosylformylglycinamidine synthase subunit PurQ [candidate division Zixibacteria bacterium]